MVVVTAVLLLVTEFGGGGKFPFSISVNIVPTIFDMAGLFSDMVDFITKGDERLLFPMALSKMLPRPDTRLHSAKLCMPGEGLETIGVDRV